ncbi:MAG: hypothetical protein LBM75_05655 [Myxococcales bacterium]|nr:hypothetical protein [Myxococcales bacterium]
MSRYLQDCDVREMRLVIPERDEEALLNFFDGSDRAGGASAKATRQGPCLKIEAVGGKLVLRANGRGFEAEELRIFDDRSGVFFDEVVVALFVTYRGALRCSLRWSGARASQWEETLCVEAGRCTPNRDGVTPGRWLSAMSQEPSDEEINDRLEEGRRLFDEYQRIKSARRLLPEP